MEGFPEKAPWLTSNLQALGSEGLGDGQHVLGPSLGSEALLGNLALAPCPRFLACRLER